VPDAAIAYQRALAAGATPVTEVTALFFGDRVGRVRDPLGNAVAQALRYVEESLDTALRDQRA
jgi:uncharacterized glyoxalase superfamily protein PhnB